jgi:hypothetical protein
MNLHFVEEGQRRCMIADCIYYKLTSVHNSAPRLTRPFHSFRYPFQTGVELVVCWTAIWKRHDMKCQNMKVDLKADQGHHHSLQWGSKMNTGIAAMP